MSKKNKVNDGKKKVNKRNNIFKKIFCVNGRFELIGLLKNLAIPLVGGIIISLITKDSMSTYGSLKKSILTPPAFVFSIVWTILYIMMGLAAYRIYMNNKQGKNDYNGYFNYLVQLLINFLWSIIFFNFRLYGIAFIEAVILLILVFITTKKFFKVDKIAGWLMVPYVFWLTYASVLSYFVWVLNEM